MRTWTALTMLLACALLACSLTTGRDDADDPSEEGLRPPPPPTGPSTVITAAVPYFGEESIEERIARADTIVKARLNQTTSETITSTDEGWIGKYYVALRFRLTVSEYLNGSGGNSITALTIQGGTYDAQKEAEAAAPGIVAKRVATWDDREAIFFLNEEDPEGTFSASVQGANDYFLTVGGTYQDMYSLHNRYRKLWLPSAGTTATGDSQEFLLAVPESGLDTPTITLGALKSRITSVNAELNGGDGSEAYKDCIRNKYQGERMERYRMSRPGARYRSFEPIWSGTFASGQPAEAELYDYDYGFVATGEAEKKTRFWIDGQDAALFSIEEGDRRPYSVENQMRFTYSVVAVRPIPAGVYKFNHHIGGFIDCGDTATFAITANVNAPAGTLHEAFFDPVTVAQAEGGASAVAADSTNGVLKPASFTDANGASATLQSISYDAPSTGQTESSGQSGTVKLSVSPHTGLTGHVLNFIALDGTVSLSLSVANATVDAANKTLSWTVSSQPWKAGDKLMLRIHDGSVTPTPPVP